jgi:hypothetical protein
MPRAFKYVAVPTWAVQSHRHPSLISRHTATFFHAAGRSSPQCRSPISLLLVIVNRTGVRLQSSATKPPSTSSTVRRRHRCFVRCPDHLTPSHFPRRSSAVEPSQSPSTAAIALPPALAVVDHTVFCRRPSGNHRCAVFFSEAGRHHPHPLHSPQVIVIELVAGGSKVVGATPPSSQPTLPMSAITGEGSLAPAWARVHRCHWRSAPQPVVPS